MTPEAREALRKAGGTLDVFARAQQRIADEWAGMSAARKDRANREMHRRFAAVCRGLARASKQLGREPAPEPAPVPQTPIHEPT